ncbi:conjugal transfer protein TraD [uncultured Vibrio sp.]|uniref:conjugal transfer protein TraD n=1 Tax=uncultured Vibrio sp. TaxID=114054 RepID=UPI002AA7CA85|nr:conjugal transfer protein TraD [uncultured Vibrio sp.]
MHSEEREQYASYNSLARKPLMLGIPIIPLIMGALLMLITGWIGLSFFGVKGLVFPAFIALGLLYIRIRSMEDSRAIDDMKWEAKGFLTRLRCQSNTISFTSIDNHPFRRKQHVSEWLKNNTHD